MTSESNRRRPLVIVTLAAVALVALGLIIPLVGGVPEIERAIQGGLVRAAARDSFSLSSPLTLLETPRLVLEDGTVSVATGHGSTPSTGQALYRLLTGGGADLVLDRATLTLHRADPPRKSAAGDAGTVVGIEALGPIATALARLDFGTLTVRDGTVVIKGEGNSQTTLRNVSAEITSDRKASLEAKGTLRLRGETLSFDVALVRPKDKADTSLAIRASVKGELIAADIDGRLVPDRLQVTAGAAELRIPRLREAARWLGAHWAEGQGPVALQAKGQLEWSEGTISFEAARFALDGNTASGGLSFKLGGDRPAIEGTLAFDSLNLAPYVREMKPATALAVATDWLSFSRLPVGLSPSLIREFDADLRISAASVSVADQVLGRCAAAISIKDGKLLADLAEVELDHGGSGDGQFGADLTGVEPRYTLRGKLESFDMGRATGTYLGRPAVEGLGTLAVELSGEGRTGDAILGSLSGNIAIDMPEGARLGVDVLGFENATIAGRQDRGWDALPKGATDVESLIARFAATGGVFTAQVVQANAGETVVTAAGTISASERAIDLTVLVSGGKVHDGGSGTEAKPPAAKAFRLHGPWAAPGISPVRGPEKVGFVSDR